MDYKSLIEESNIQNNYHNIQSILNIYNQSSLNYIKNTIEKQWEPHTAPILSSKIKALSQKISTHDISNCQDLFRKLAANESALQPFITKYSTTNNIQDGSLSLLYFRGENTWHLNFIPFFLSIWCFAKKYIFPGIQLLLPILALLAPYLLLITGVYLLFFTTYTIDMKKFFAIADPIITLSALAIGLKILYDFYKKYKGTTL
jgi:hypothetical protein